MLRSAGRRQSQAAALRLGAEVRIENAREVLLRYPDALIDGRDADVRARLDAKPMLGTPRDLVDVLRPNRHLAAVRHRLVRIDQQVAEHLDQLRGVRLDRPEVRRGSSVTVASEPRDLAASWITRPTSRFF
jgi:hypothetical protein